MEKIKSVLFIQDNGITKPCSLVVNSKLIREKTTIYKSAIKKIYVTRRNSRFWKFVVNNSRNDNIYLHVQPKLFQGILLNSSFKSSSAKEVPYSFYLSRSVYNELPSILKYSASLLDFKVDDADIKCFKRSIQTLRYIEFAVIFGIIILFVILICI